jgi:soluble lytic murein transglycosylase
MAYFSKLRLCFFSSILISFSLQAFALGGDDDFLQARAAYDKRNEIALSEYAERLQNQNYILAPYAAYWRMLMNLEVADNQTIVDFINNYNDYPFADRLRGEFLKKLGRKEDWAAFAEEFVNYHSDDAGVACYEAEASLANGDLSVLESEKKLWMQAKEQPGNCNNLFDRMQAANILTEDDIWARFRMAYGENRITLAKAIAKRSKNFEPSNLKLIDKANVSPTLFLSKRMASSKTRIGRELNLFALNRIAKTDSQQAISAFKNVETLLTPEDKSEFYGKLALQAALRQEPDALQWFQKADLNNLNREQLAWFVRSALRQNNWPGVLTAIAKMEPMQSEEGAWRYWKARALKSLGQNVEANGLFAKLSTERHFYGWLAQEEMDGFISAAPVNYSATDEDVTQISQLLAFQRVEALFRVNLRWEAKAEWALATKDFNDQQLLAAAEYAARKQWYDLAIITADKTTEMHDFALRYPTPYRDLMKSAAGSQGVDEAWVYGITRQESRFIHNARSSVGAAGLMQIMPATAKWAAPRAGVTNYNNNMIHDLDTNITLGTYYLSHILGLFNGQEVMASAAYNAGPSRAKKWLADMPLEGAVYAETIPFSETRIYVQKVMANAHLYAQRLGLKSIPLKKRLGVVPSKSGMMNIDETEFATPDIPDVDAGKQDAAD